MKAAVPLLALALAAVLAVPAAQAGPEVTLLLHHPADGVDPLGVAYEGGDAYFFQRYAPLVADKGRFDYPFFVADGTHAIEGPVDAARPFVAARDAYDAAVSQRLALPMAVTLRLSSTVAGDEAVVSVRAEPVAPLPGEDLHLMLALAEDPVHYQPPASLSNGIVDHRFTVRAVADLGALDLTAPADGGHTFRIAPGWARDRLLVAAWLQQDAPSLRFDAREVAQATHAPLGDSVVQDTRGVLAEMLSATWCTPCGPGDLAAEAVAVAHGSAEPLEASSGPRYFQAPRSPTLAIVAAALAAVGTAWLGGRR